MTDWQSQVDSSRVEPSRQDAIRFVRQFAQVTLLPEAKSTRRPELGAAQLVSRPAAKARSGPFG